MKTAFAVRLFWGLLTALIALLIMVRGGSPNPSYPPNHDVHRAYRTRVQTLQMNAFGDYRETRKLH